MKSDHPIYQFLATGAQAFQVLTGITLIGRYRFDSLTFKTVERRIDGVFEPQGHDGPAYVVEFQTQFQLTSWYNLLTKIGLYGESHPEREVRGILIFPHKRLDPGMPGKLHLVAAPLLSVVYLEDFLPNLLLNNSHNPFVAVLAPLILSSDEELAHQAPQLWRTIHLAPLSPSIRIKLERILEFWFFERFNTLTEQEILDMLQTIVPLEQTRAYQSIFAKGIARGEAKGKVEGKAEGKVEGKAEGKVEGQIMLLKRQISHRFGKVPKWANTRLSKADTAQIDAWADAIFDVNNIEQLLGKNGSGMP